MLFGRLVVVVVVPMVAEMGRRRFIRFDRIVALENQAALEKTHWRLRRRPHQKLKPAPNME